MKISTEMCEISGEARETLPDLADERSGQSVYIPWRLKLDILNTHVVDGISLGVNIIFSPDIGK